MHVPRPALHLELQGDREIVFTRDFRAPRELVFEALTQPELLRRWFVGPPGWTLETCEVDLRVGGAYRYVWASPEGQPMGMGGVYREVQRPERLVHTELFDQAWYPGEALITVRLDEIADDSTRMTLKVEYSTPEGRAAALKTPMERGMEMSYQRLDGMLPEMAARR